MNKKDYSVKTDVLNNEQGAILLTVLILLVMLTILGAMSISTSTTEVDISGNFRRSQIAFYAADAGIEYAMTASTIYSTIGTGTYSETRTIDDGVSGNTDYTAQVQVEYLATGAVPVGSGYGMESGEAGSLNADYFHATSTGTGPNNTQIVVDVQYAKLVQSGGGI